LASVGFTCAETVKKAEKENANKKEKLFLKDVFIVIQLFLNKSTQLQSSF
jgi:hypothetical protein